MSTEDMRHTSILRSEHDTMSLTDLIGPSCSLPDWLGRVATNALTTHSEPECAAVGLSLFQEDSKGLQYLLHLLSTDAAQQLVVPGHSNSLGWQIAVHLKSICCASFRGSRIAVSLLAFAAFPLASHDRSAVEVSRCHSPDLQTSRSCMCLEAVLSADTPNLPTSRSALACFH